MALLKVACRGLLVGAAFVCLVHFVGCGQPGEQPQKLAEIVIRVGDVPIIVEVARTEPERRLGLMYRDNLPEGHGMLFVFPREERLAFYMENTRFDLDLAYFRADGELFQIERMKAYDTTSVYSREPVLYALEVPAGFFLRRGIKCGDRLVLPREIKAR